MKRILLAAFFALFLPSLYGRAQEAVWPVSNGVVLASDPISGQALVTLGGSIIQAHSNGVIDGLGYSISGNLSGDLGASGAGSLLAFVCTTDPPLLVSYSTYTPGVHGVTATLTVCDGPAGGTMYKGNLLIVVPAPGPPTTPPPGPGCTPYLVDPVKSNLLRGTAITSNPSLLANSSNATVVGVSADGVTQALVAIPANNIGDVVQLSLINDAGSSSSSSDQDGGLMPLEGNPNSLSNNQNLVAIDPGNGQPIAFAIYRAPTNYARGTQNFPQDNTSTQRQVSFQVICPASNGSLANPTNTSVTVVRPPVVLVHGLWVDPKTVATIWSSFAPTAGSSEAQLWSQLDQNPGEQIFWADYSASVQVGSIVPSFTNPLPPFNSISQVSGSALGFQFNAPIVLSQVQKYITTYANDLNVAAVQADVIAHSMGGNIVRTMAVPNESWNFLTNGTYGQGPIEKLITIGTPHLGSPLAVDLLPTSSGQDPNSCVRNTLAFKTVDLAFQSANVAGNSVNGGVNDLVGDGQDTFGLSLALQSLQASQRSQPFPMAYLAGTESQGNLAHLSSCSVSGCTAAFINSFCGGLFGNPLANDLTTNNWPNVFGGNASDGIVPLKSQLNGASAGGSPGGGGPVTNIIHSAGLYSLDFIGFNDLNSSTMAGDAMDLLNEAKNGPDYQ